MCRLTVTQIRASSLRRQVFSTIVIALRNGVDLQLLRDVDTRWSSVLLMIERALELRHVSYFFHTIWS
jgi:hypothetical protein